MKLGLAALVWAVCFAGGARAAVVYGDANGDGQVSPADATVMMRVSGGLAAPSITVRRNGDVAPLNDYEAGSFGDGRIDIRDAVRVLRYLRGLEPPVWPAKPSCFLLEVGNALTYRVYDSSGTPLTGPGTGIVDAVSTVAGLSVKMIDGVPRDVYRLVSPFEERELAAMPDPATSRLGVATLGSHYSDGSSDAYTPPKLLLEYPVQSGTAWGPYPITAKFSGTPYNLTYSGTTEGPLSLSLPTGLVFDGAYKVTVSESGTGYSNTTVLWVVPYLGLVMSGYTETESGGTTTVMPQTALVSANIHGVLYP